MALSTSVTSDSLDNSFWSRIGSLPFLLSSSFAVKVLLYKLLAFASSKTFLQRYPQSCLVKYSTSSSGALWLIMRLKASVVSKSKHKLKNNGNVGGQVKRSLMVRLTPLSRWLVVIDERFDIQSCDGLDPFSLAHCSPQMPVILSHTQSAFVVPSVFDIVLAFDSLVT